MNNTSTFWNILYSKIDNKTARTGSGELSYGTSNAVSTSYRGRVVIVSHVMINEDIIACGEF